MEELEVMDVMAQVRHVFGSESFIWRMEGLDGVQGIWWGHARSSQSWTDTISSLVSVGRMRGMRELLTFVSMYMPSAWDVDLNTVLGN